MARATFPLPAPTLHRTTGRPSSAAPAASPALAHRCRRKFLRYFPQGFQSKTYVDWERGYKWAAHELWQKSLSRTEHRVLMWKGQHQEIARRAVGIESRTNLLFSFEKMAVRDAVRSKEGARVFSEALYDFLYARGAPDRKFESWCNALESLPRRQTRVLTWPVVTIFGFLALPDAHLYLKPNVTRRAAQAYGFPFAYASRPNWETYESLRTFADKVRRDQRDLRPKDMIDLQSFIWVQGSDEYD